MIEVRTGSWGPDLGEIREKTERPMASSAHIADAVPVSWRIRLVVSESIARPLGSGQC
jgi:hypothetical protein